MSALIKIATNVFVRAFYLENASFFLVVLGIVAGFMRDVEHIALAEFFVSRPYLVLIPFFIWILYALKILNFNSACLRKPENSFFYLSIFFTKGTRFLMTGLIIIAQLSPVLLYGIFLIATAGKHGLYDTLFLIVVCMMSLGFVLILHLNRLIRHPDQDKKTSRFVEMINHLIIRPYPFFSLEWLSRKKTLMLLGSKIFGMALLFAVSKLYAADHYDLRLMSMALMVVAGVCGQLIFEIHQFDNYHFAIIRQLPFTLLRRIFNIIISIAFLTLPEAGILITYFPSHLTLVEILQGLLFLVTLQFFWYGLLFLKSINQEVLMKIVFALSVTGFVLILFKVPLWLFTAAVFSFGLFVWKKYYYTFEYDAV